MTTDWKNLIAAMVFVKQGMWKITEFWPYHLPSLAAGEDQIRLTEGELGYDLDEGFRAFLKYANGWLAFLHRIDLFGTDELLGSPLMEYAKSQLEWLEDDVLETSGFTREELLPIAATLTDKDLFVISTPKSHNPGVVIWFAGEEIDRYPNFEEYFLAMIEYNRLELEDFRRELLQDQ